MSGIPASPRIYSILLAAIVRGRRIARGPLLRRAYWAGYNFISKKGPPIRTRLHGFSVLLNRGNLYPFLVRDVPLFNAPLVELTHALSSSLQRPIVVIDVGAATGDTVLLLKERCPNAVSQFICIEGDAEFYALLQANTRPFTDVLTIQALLSSDRQSINSLVKHHEGTAMAAGSEQVEAVPLDSLSSIRSSCPDLLKIDVDGFDGEVLAGAARVLQDSRPAVIFEWHPKLAAEAGTDALRAFDVLARAQYSRYLWFNNNGSFSHFSEAPSLYSLQQMIHYLRLVNERSDPHFDVIALHKEHNLCEVSIAALGLSFGSPKR